MLDEACSAELDRADRALTAALAGSGLVVSRSWVQRAIDSGEVLVDGRVVTRKTALALGQRVELLAPSPPLTAVRPDASVKFGVVYKDDDLLVVDKPAGLVVHPAKGHWEGTLVHGLLALGIFSAEAVSLAGDADADEEHHRPGIVHRLDRDTSGLLVVARNDLAREGLKRLFAEHDIDREYVAITVGRTKAGTFDTPHGRHPTERLRFTSFPKASSRRAITHVAVLEDLVGATLVRCTLETGRTHQIRIHLAERAKTPILGDLMYGRTPPEPLRAVAAALGRQALHARVLGFVHPRTGERLRFESPLPADLQAALDALRATKPSISRGPST